MNLCPRIAVLVGALLLVASACSGDDSVDTDKSSARSAAARTETSGEAVDVDGTNDPDGERFTDPEGDYKLTIDSSWQAQHGALAEGIELWFVAPRDDGFSPNVTILTQASAGLDLDAYMELSVENGASFIDSFDERSHEIVAGANGQQLGVMEYTGSQAGHDLAFLAVVALVDEQAVVATLTTGTDSVDELSLEVEPYLLTLETT